METEKNSSKNRIRDALSRIYEEKPPQFKEYLKRYKENPKSRVFAPLAEAYRRQGKLEEAIQICKEGLTHHPDFHGGKVALAKCYIDKKWFEEAKDELEEVAAEVPDNLLAAKLLGECYLALEDSEKALHSFKLALVQAPNDSELAKRIQTIESENLRPRPPEIEDEVVVKSAGERQKLEKEEDANIDGIEVAYSLSATQAPMERGNGDAVTEPDLIPAVTSDGRIEMVPYSAEDQEETLEKVLGFGSEDEPDSFQVEHVSHVFQETPGKREINTETLGDLYFSQGQYEQSLRIFEKLNAKDPVSELQQKIVNCKARLGVDGGGQVRSQQIKALQSILDRMRDN